MIFLSRKKKSSLKWDPFWNPDFQNGYKQGGVNRRGGVESGWMFPISLWPLLTISVPFYLSEDLAKHMLKRPVWISDVLHIQ